MALIRIRRPNPPTKVQHAWLFDYLKNNFIVVISAIITFFGLCSVYAYHFHIEYFPFFEIQSLASMIFATAYIGILLLFGLGSTSSLPAIYMALLYRKRMALNNNVPKISEVVGRLVCISFFGLVAWVIWIAIATVFGLFVYHGIIFIFVAFILYMLYKRSFLRMESVWRQQEKIWPRFKNWFIGELPIFINFLSWIWICVLQFFPIYIFFFVIADNPDFQIDDLPKVFMAGMLLIGSQWYLVVSWADRTLEAKHRLSSILLALVMPFFISFFCGNPAFIFTSIAHTTKIGNFYATELTLTKHGCNVVAGEGAKLCEEKGVDTFKICGAYVMSRFGSETYLKVNYVNEDDHSNSSKPKETPKVSLTATASVSPDPKEESKAQAATAAKNLRSIFLPSADIVGMKVNMNEKHFNVASIIQFLRTTNANCPAPAKVEKAKPVTFKDSDLFEQNKHAITLQGEQKLAALIKKFSDDKRKIATIKIVGYADQEGSAASNFTLSQMRALSVENFFRNNLPAGTMPINIHSQGVGSTRLAKTDVDCPLKMKKRTDCLAENRRVDIEVTDE